MILSCCIIVKDDTELSNLDRCVMSVIKYVDEIVISANGKEVKKIEEYCKQSGKIKYFYQSWTKDFSAARNFCASKVREDADYYIWIDSDDVLIGGDILREIAVKAKKNDLDAVFFTYWYSCSFTGEPSADTVKNVELTQIRERLLRPGSIMWKKRLHETPVPVKHIDYKYTEVKYSQEEPIVWLHLGVERGMPLEEQLARTARNRELLELDLEEERKGAGADPRTLLYLMKIYAETGTEVELKKNLDMGNEYLLKSGWDAERATCCALMGRSLEKLGKTNEAKDFLFKSIKEYPFDPILYLHLSRVCGNLKQFREMKHWLSMALNIDSSQSSANLTNIFELKLLSTELLMYYYFNGERNVRKAYKSMKLLYNDLPTKENREKLLYLEELKKLDENSESAHKLMLYYQDLNNSEGVVKIFESMPQAMQDLPFASFMYNKHCTPKTWDHDEVCYYATFGKAHFEQWGPDSLTKGVGGSETAVIRLSQEWTKKGYRVTVYCDCGTQEGVHDGVTYLKYYKMNPRDNFNIFINWRDSRLAGRVKAKKFIVDMHDLYAEDSIKNQRYDKIFVKSNFHRELAPNIPDDKFIIVSNGI
jgi:glycosyltransferase involved in cell wall biosynthesis